METYTLPAVLDSLSSIRNYVMEAAERAGIKKSRAYDLALGVDEIATNTINYGYADAEGDNTITLSIDQDDQSFRVTLEDSGKEFDPRELPQPDVNAPAEERGIGGLGVFLALNGVDVFDYRYEDGVNKNIFVLNLSTSSGSP